MIKAVIRVVLSLATLSLLPCARAVADVTTDFIPTFSALGLEELLTQPVTSVLRKEQPLSRAPAAVYVLTADDIRRAGATSIPEVLRLVPGLTVLRRSASNWEITARGFDSNGSAKLLVLIDGRSVYSPLFSGVFWDVQHTPLSDIERIEVIRGPGAVTWGENAVNGVINIITKLAKDTQGLRVTVGGGKEEQGFGTIRYGGRLSESTHFRAFVNHSSQDELQSSVNGGGAGDDWYMTRAGFRVDSELSAANALTLQGDIYSGESHFQAALLESFALPAPVRRRFSNDLQGGNLLMRLSRDLSDTSRLKFQTYYDRTARKNALYEEERDTFDFDAQHRFRVLDRHDIVYGANYRLSMDEVRGSLVVDAQDKSRTDQLFNAFIQDEYTLVPGRWSIIPGIKAGVNDYTGFEYQPALKSVYTPDRTRAFWGSIARAVRTPARIDDDIRINSSPVPAPDGRPAIVSIFGNRGFDAEDLLAYELGYRTQPSNTLSFDVAAFYHDYSNLLSLEPLPAFEESSPAPVHIVNPRRIENNLEGRAHGIELASTWRARSYLQFKATYSYIHLDFSPVGGSRDMSSRQLERGTPHHQGTFRVHADLPKDVQFGVLFYYTDSLPRFNIGSSLRTDIRLAWQPSRETSLELIGQNLFRAPHREYGATGSQVEPAVFGRFTWSFN